MSRRERYSAGVVAPEEIAGVAPEHQGLAKFLYEVVGNILAKKNTSGGPYHHWNTARNAAGYIPIEAVLKAHTISRSIKAQPHLPMVLRQVLAQPPFEMRADGEAFRMIEAGSGAAGGAPAAAASPLAAFADVPVFVPNANWYGKHIAAQFNPGEPNNLSKINWSTKVPTGQPWGSRKTRKNRKIKKSRKARKSRK